MRIFVISCWVLVATSAVLGASRAVIHLRNGDAIYADEVEEGTSTVRYETGDNSFTIPRSKVLSIELTPESGQASEIAVAPPRSTLQPKAASDRELLEQVLRNDGVDRDVIASIEARQHTDSTAIAYYIAGKSEYESGKFVQAKHDFQTALGFQPENPAILAYYAALLVRTGDSLGALSYAERATRIAPDSADAMSVLGYAQFASGRNRDAIQSWKKALALRPDAAIQGMLLKAERETSAERDYSERATSHFVLRYEGSQSSDGFRDQLLSTLESHYQDLVHIFGSEPRSSVPVVLYTSQAFFDVTRAPTWIGALNDGKLRIPLHGVDSVTPELSRIVRHELTHTFVNQLSASRCPAWLNEGIAQMLEPRALASRGARLAQLLKAEREIPLNMLERGFGSFSTEEAVLAYDESLLAANYLDAHYGMGEIVELLKRIGQGDSVESALRVILHSDYGRLEEGIRSELVRASQ
jgi:tetratricopeptide (TPR) repeat protein